MPTLGLERYKALRESARLLRDHFVEIRSKKKKKKRSYILQPSKNNRFLEQNSTQNQVDPHPHSPIHTRARSAGCGESWLGTFHPAPIVSGAHMHPRRGSEQWHRRGDITNPGIFWTAKHRAADTTPEKCVLFECTDNHKNGCTWWSLDCLQLWMYIHFGMLMLESAISLLQNKSAFWMAHGRGQSVSLNDTRDAGSFGIEVTFKFTAPSFWISRYSSTQNQPWASCRLPEKPEAVKFHFQKFCISWDTSTHEPLATGPC